MLHRQHYALLSGHALALIGIIHALGAQSWSTEPLGFNRDVRPILNEHCISCHGPDSASRQAGLRLDQRDAAIAAGAISPRELDESELIARITSTDPDLVMPPPEIKKTLKPEQIETLKRWIADGAEYQPHWSLIAPTKHQPPQVKIATWVRNPIDQFIAAKLEQANLTPAPEADRRTIARRVSFDLTGLASTPEEVEAFVNDPRPDAYERFVERLLASPRWGEHRARYWLDVARYADTHGIHFDNYREMWPYREWVINAFNANMPFDEFTIKNLAGDLLPNVTLDDQVASGFHRCNITTSEGGAIDEEYEVLYTRDRTETTSIAWMGLTAGCAVCHDHKFDPLSQTEFYELSAFFNNITQAAMDGNVKDTPPIVFVPLPADRKLWKESNDSVSAVEAELQTIRTQLANQPGAEFINWITNVSGEEFNNSNAAVSPIFHVPLDDGTADVSSKVYGKKLSFTAAPTVEWRPGPLDKPAAYLSNGSAFEVAELAKFTGDDPYSCAVWMKMPASDSSYAVVARIDDSKVHTGWDLWVEDHHLCAHLIHRWRNDAIKVRTRAPFPADAWLQVVLTYDGSRRARGFRFYVNGALAELEVLNDNLSASTTTNVPLKLGQRMVGGAAQGLGLCDVRIYDRELSAAEAAALNRPALEAAVGKPPSERTELEKEILRAWWLEHHNARYQKLMADRLTLQQSIADMKKRGGLSHVMAERPAPAMAHVLNRGEYDQPLAEVTPATPAMLPPMPAELPRNRLGLAEWLLRDEHPLTARVTVNRFWQEVFGAGLVKTSGDFGVTGEQPSHPELLDWLAITFREQGWDVKQLFRLIVTSSAYRQAAIATPEKLERDAENRLLSRGPRFRMDAEMVRDHALASSGLLVERIGGPSVKPYQPPGVWEAVGINGSNTRSYRPDTGDALYRRSLYTFWKRSAPPASLDLFNAPNRESCVMLRERTNTPMQALVTLNDPTYVEAAKILAESLCKKGASTPETRLAQLSSKLLGRPLGPKEVAILTRSLDSLQQHYTANAAAAHELLKVGSRAVDEELPAPELAAWTMVANELMNLDENVNK